MPDREIYEEVVSLANSKGGVLLIGVEDDGTITGAHPRHGNATDPPKLQSAIFNNTVPSINTRDLCHNVTVISSASTPFSTAMAVWPGC